MLIATWNVNSIRARESRLLDWLAQRKPDVVCLQELKVADEEFPADQLESAGYHSAVCGQKTYNGVALLSRIQPKEIQRGFGDSRFDDQARLIAATIRGYRVVSAYVPNGDVVGSEKYEYKTDWLAALRDYLHERNLPKEKLILCGDLNIAPAEIDVAQPELWGGSVLCHAEMQDEFQQLLDAGLTDVFRMHHPDDAQYSWWDYRGLAFPRNNGLRIDHVLATQPAAKRCTDAWIDRDARKGKKPSDHAPVLAEFKKS